MTAVYDRTADRLAGYGLFSGDVIDKVSGIAEIQSHMDYGTFLGTYGVPAPKMIDGNGTRTSEVLDIIPQRDYDHTQARLVHLSMGNYLSSRQLYQIATNYAVDPTVRTIAVSNPGSPGHHAGTLTLKNCLEVVHGNMQPLIDPVLRYVSSQNISTTEQRGFSYGSLLALTATEYADRYDQEVTQVTVFDPADVPYRRDHTIPSMAGLFWDFLSTSKPVARYVADAGIEAYSATRQDSITGLAKYLVGVFRATNLSATSHLAGNYFVERSERALDAQLNARMHAIWGSESELCTDGFMKVMAGNLRQNYPERFDATRVVGGRHNMVSDIHLQAALLLRARGR